MNDARDKAQTPEAIVWIVEDNELFRRDLDDLINQAEGMYCPFSFNNCEDALRSLRGEAPPDVVLLDIGLPGMSGLEGVGRIKALSPSTHVIILTVQDDENKVFNAICNGASGYLLKASTADGVIVAIEEVLKGGAPMSPLIARKFLDAFAKTSSPKPEYGLTDREKEILQLLTDGFSKQRIADKLFLSYHTVDSHLRNIYQKLHVQNRTSAVAKSLKEHLL
ncbi:MAG: response regulator transcription factor [Bacteroidota bacterium]|jgi:DNA-binding NarL/FixJ family response regulator